jgi:DNA-binding NarL/FixJ family response regulator
MTPRLVLTVDDHPLIRAALREVLQASAGATQVLEACDPDEGLALLRRHPTADLVFLDLHFSAHDGLKCIAEFRRAAPATPVIVYTMHEDADTVEQALAQGASGIVPKTHSRKLLEAAIEVVMQGGIYLPPAARRLVAREPRPASPAPAPSISGQQLRILDRLARGLSNKQIAKELGIASSTVKNQLTVVFDKLRVSNRTQAAIAARAFLQSSREPAPR